MRLLFRYTTKLLILAALILSTTHLTVLAKSSLPIPDKTVEEFVKGDVPAPSTDKSGQKILDQLIANGLLYVKIVTAVIAILYITIMGYQLVVQGDQEEEVTRVKRGLIYTIVALVLISMAEDVGRIFDMEEGSLLGSPQEVLNRIRLFDRRVEISITFIKHVIGAFATLMVVRSSIKLITAGGDEEQTSKHKKGLIYSAAGLILVFLGDIFVNKVFYKVDKNVYSGITGVHPKVDVKYGVEQIAGATNFIVTLIAPIAVLMLVVGAILYATAGGEEENMEKAKRLIVSVIIGLVMIFAAFSVVSTVLAGRLETIGAIA